MTDARQRLRSSTKARASSVDGSEDDSLDSEEGLPVTNTRQRLRSSTSTRAPSVDGSEDDSEESEDESNGNTQPAAVVEQTIQEGPSDSVCPPALPSRRSTFGPRHSQLKVDALKDIEYHILPGMKPSKKASKFLLDTDVPELDQLRIDFPGLSDQKAIHLITSYVNFAVSAALDKAETGEPIHK